MAGYQLEGPKPARMYEVILPKKLGYFGKFEQVLDDLFREEKIRRIPSVVDRIADHRRADPGFDVDAWVRTLCRASRGYSIYEMDGRYLSAAGPIDERVLVIRFIFHELAGDGDVDTSMDVVNHLVAHRFAAELGGEEEIWFLEYPQTRLAIWRKQGTPGDPSR